MMKFAKLFPDEQIVAQLAQQLYWSHFVEVIPLKNDLQREFYITMAGAERDGTRGRNASWIATILLTLHPYV